MFPEDAELIQAYQNGEAEAFAALVRKYERPLFTFLLSLVGNRQSAEDLFQDTFLQKENPACFEQEAKIRELERQSHELGESYRKAQDDAARKMLRSNLTSVITQLFDLREMNRQEEVKRMEAELKRLKDTLAQRQQNRMNITERRIQQLTGEAGAMEWE